MYGFDKAKHPRPHLEIEQPASESQAVISWGEEILDRIHRVAHEIEEHVRRALETPGHAPTFPSSKSSDPSRR